MLRPPLPTLDRNLASACELGRRFAQPGDLYHAWGRPHCVSHWSDAGDQESWDYRVSDGALSFIIRPGSRYCRLHTARLLVKVLEPYARTGASLRRLQAFLSKAPPEGRDVLGKYFSGRNDYNQYLHGADGSFLLLVKDGVIRNSKQEPPPPAFPLYRTAYYGETRFRP